MPKATGARKGSIDRLVRAGPVSRTMAEAAEIAIGCGLYRRHRDLQSKRLVRDRVAPGRDLGHVDR